MQGYKDQINERLAQERRSQLTKIMQENYKMLERIKKCRSKYAIEGGGTLSQRKRAQLAEKLAEGLVRVRWSKERQKVKVKRRDGSRQSSIGSLPDNNNIGEDQSEMHGGALSLQIPANLSTIDSKSGRTHSKRNLPCIISSSSHRVLDLEEHKILKSLAIPYEKSKYRQYYERLDQINGLP